MGFSIGSSPLAWGTARHGRKHRFQIRFIPTRVGNRRGGQQHGIVSSVHPHSRGEQGTSPFSSCPCTGSSPLAWGTVVCCIVGQQHLRFIPTRVGNSRTCSMPIVGRSVHPHSRGEQNCSYVWLMTRTGSSPLAWGTALFPADIIDGDRFIPTRVGNRRRRRSGR